jgi:Mg-chelatase subunit ChlD
MARTKQTARKSAGGSASRKQLATKASRSLRQFFISQQSSGFSSANGKEKKKIFINCENTFASFSVTRKRTDKAFQMSATTTRLRSELLLPKNTNKNGEVMVKIDFLSNLDGNISAEQRPPIDCVFVLDISGSMSMSFPEDIDNRNKLDVAKDCILKITEQLLDTDRAAVAIFNDSATTIFKLSNASKGNLAKLKSKLRNVQTFGGTNLSVGLQHGYSIIRENNKKNREENTARLQRVFFLTDMESTSSDEARVIAIAKFQALVESIDENVPMGQLPAGLPAMFLIYPSIFLMA